MSSPIVESPVSEEGVEQQYTKKDFMSDQIIRWCPGCGDYSILSQVQTVLPTLGIPKENYAFISGIGCSSRFPYYMNTYGFHTIHGRAPAVVTGLKATRPELSVWLVTGDGDGLSIGGNHMIHLLRRNVDTQVLLFNNRIYGLTKGQYSPTSEEGKKTKSTPMGSLDAPFNPLALALGAGATFLGRSADVLAQPLREVIKAAHDHRGTSFVEIFQNCNIFNDGAFDAQVGKDVRDDALLFLVHGQPMIYGKGNNKGLRLNGLTLEVVTWEAGEAPPADLLVHNMYDRTLAYLLINLPAPEFPVVMGVIFKTDRPTYDQQFVAQVEAAKARRTPTLDDLYREGATWEVV